MKFNHQLSWKAVLTNHPNQDLAHIHNSSPSLSDDVIMSLGTHESRSASIIPRGSSWATWCPRIYRRQEVPPQTWEPSAKPPTRKGYRRGEKAGTEEEVQNSKRTRRLRWSVIEDEMKCRVQRGLGYKSWKTGERRKWEKEGQIKGKGKATVTQNRLINGGLLSCGVQKTFLTNMLEPSSYWGLVKIYTTDAKWVEVCIVMPHYLETRQQQSQDLRSSPSRSHDCELSPIFHSVTNVMWNDATKMRYCTIWHFQSNGTIC